MMPAPDGTGLQANFKTPAGTLLNLYAMDESDLSVKLEAVERLAGQIASVEGLLAAGSAAAPALAPPSQQSPPPPPPPVPVAPPPQPLGPPAQPQDAPGAAPTCNHGPRVWRQGVARSGKPFKLWACPSPDRAAQCPPQWVN